ncbi:TIR-like protein FxsC [Streptomyces sp. DSM 40907]|uniref:TIR-like protein FxsC n=1 Tax=Streptomyces kutzneri TaxID=3051179 RepID=UPI0028D6FF2D|nr:TIR-like protein FxsC [Streptomyces sp. DSM 40907]
MPEPPGSPDGPAALPDRRDDPLATVVSALDGLGRELDGTSVAELLWLAAASRGGRPADHGGAAPAAGAPAAPGAVDPRERISAWGPSLTPVYGPSGPGGEVRPARKVSLPRGTALPRAREIARALRPLRRPWAAGRRHQLDVGETVSGYARSGELLPVFRPAPERWFDATVVLDRSPTMAVWGDTVDELLKVLATTGAFRTLRVREVDAWEAEPGAARAADGRRPGGGGRTARQRRLVLVFSDCVAGAGGDEGLWDRIHHWAGSAPTVLVNPLPPRIWRHTGLDLPAVRVTTPGAPGVSNAGLRFALPPLMEDVLDLRAGPGDRRTAWLPLPVTGLTPRSLARWARTLMRGDPEGCEAVLLPEPGSRSAPPTPPDPLPDAGQLVEAFLHRASVPAVRLAVLCSSYPGLNTGMLHLVRQELVPEASPADMAEVVVGGLVSVDEGGPGAGGPVLLFRDGVRERLAPRLGARDKLRTREAVSRFIAAHADAPSRFPALVPDADGDARIAPDHAPFAEAAPRTLRTPVRVSDSPAERPYFFLSYAHTPRYGTGGPDPDMWVERLFRDLCAHVMALTDLPPHRPAGFMDREIRSGEGWSDRLGSVLATCRVFVPLYSPRYFASETCGKEWFTFARRTAYHQARSASTAKAIVPASWVPVPEEHLPDVARRLDFDHHSFGERYATDGLYGLIKLRGYAEQYERTVYELAKRIVRVADTADLPVGRRVDYRSAPSAFGAPTPDENSLRIALVAPTLSDLPAGRDPRYYGPGPDDWNPYHPDSKRPLAHLATELAYHLNNQVDITTLDEEVARVAAGDRPSGPLILLVDRWALKVPALRERLAELNAVSRPGIGLLLAWNRHDAQSQAADRELNSLLAESLPNLLSRNQMTSKTDRGVLDMEEFGAVLPRIVAATYQGHLRYAVAYPPGRDGRFDSTSRAVPPDPAPPDGTGQGLSPP